MDRTSRVARRAFAAAALTSVAALVTACAASSSSNPATPRQLVTLQPQTSASALLRIVFAGNYPPSQCHPVTAHYLQVYPPNQTKQAYIAYKTTGCAKPIRLMTVDVVKPGSGSS